MCIFILFNKIVVEQKLNQNLLDRNMSKIHPSITSLGLFATPYPYHFGRPMYIEKPRTGRLENSVECKEDNFCEASSISSNRPHRLVEAIMSSLPLASVSSSMSGLNILDPLDVKLFDKELWADDTLLVIPIENTQMLIYEAAACLGVRVFLSLVQLPYRITERSNAVDLSLNGKLPVLKCGDCIVSEMEGIVRLTHAKGKSLSKRLSANEKADLRAYMSLVHNVLGRALTYFTWVDKGVYKEYTKLRVGSPFNFPLKYIYPWFRRQKIIADLRTVEWADRSIDEVFREVESCLLSLGHRLGDEKYFFGESPTELDAAVFGYLYTMITIPLSHLQLGQLVRHQPNLVQFCQNMEKECFV